MSHSTSTAVAEAPSAAPPRASLRPAWRQLRWSTRLCLMLTRLLLLVLMLEVASRLFWAIAKGVPAFHTDQIFTSFFQEFTESNVAEAPTDQKDSTLDVLVLGPSVWYWVYGDVAPRFEKALAEKLGRPVRVFNASHSGRTSRDALLVYERLAQKRFDLVVVYHAINDLFLNNCPPETFANDYTHAPRYDQIRMLDSHAEVGWFALPYTLRYLRSHIGDKLHLDSRPKRDWAHYGTTLMTPPAFRSNLEEIIRIARSRNEQVLLMTFAWHLPEDYSEEAFEAKTLDYDKHICRLLTWGTRAGITSGMRAHNDILGDLARKNPDLLFADMEALMPGGKRHYDDVCHFTATGCAAYVDLLVRHADWHKLRAP